jgi:hypothetical protein
MAGLTLAQCEQKLSEYLTAAEKVAAKQSYSIDGRSLSYANIGEIQSAIEFWDKQCRRLSRGSRGNIVARSITASD